MKHASHQHNPRTRLKLHVAATLLSALTLLLAACGGTQSAPLETVEPEAVIKDLVFSSSNNRAAPKVLDTAVVTGKLYIFTAQTSGVDKVDFYLDDPKRAGNAQTSEGQAPFDFAGASGDSANALDTTQLEDGVHTVTAAFSLSGGKTRVATATFLVDNSGKWSDTLMVSAKPSRLNGEALDKRTVSGNVYIYLMPRAGASQVSFYLDNPNRSGTPIKSERYAFFDFAGTASSGDANGFDTRKLKDGTHTVSAVVSTNGGQKVISASFTVRNAAAAPSAGLSLTLINADTDKPVAGFDPMPEGAVLDLNKLPTKNLNIRANAANVGSVRFNLDGEVTIESHEPYTLGGDDGGGFDAWTPSLGFHKLTVTPFAENYAKGASGTPLTLSFTVVQGSGASRTPAPSPEYERLEQVYVDAERGSDSNPGTLDKPLRTLNQGVSQAFANRRKGLGTRVLLQPGTYREAVNRFANGSEKSGKLIVIESVVPGEAVVSGSDVWTDWNCSGGVCSHTWPYNWGTAHNPYKEEEGIDIGPLALRSEMVVIDGGNLNQHMSRSELTSGSFAVDEGANKIYVKPPSGVDMNRAEVEVAVRGVLFRAGGLNNLVLKSLVFEHSATSFRKDAAVVLSWQDDVLLDDVTIQWNGQRGLWMGGDNYTLRNTTMNHNGGDGFEGWKLRDLLMEDTESSYNNWRGDRGGYYTWSVQKLLLVHGALIKRHKAVGNLSRGIWLDSDMVDVVIDGAYSCNNKIDGIHIEAVQGPVVVKNSTFCDNGIHGVHLLASEGVTLENNTISGNNQRAIEVVSGSRVRYDFETGKKYTLFNKDWKVRNNKVSGNDLLWFVRLYGSELSDFMNTSSFDGNTYSHSSADAAFKVSGFSYDNLTFSQWQSKTGKDGSSTFRR